ELTPPLKLDPIRETILLLLSIITNLYAVAAARDIQNFNSLFPGFRKRLRRGKADSTAQEKRRVPLWCWILAIVSLLASLVPTAITQSGYVNQFDELLHLSLFIYPRLYKVLGRAPESIFSAICLWWLGYAIFANLSNRRHPWLSLA